MKNIVKQVSCLVKTIRSWLILGLLLSLLPSPAFALAGIAERTSVFHYNDFAEVERGHPSDICLGQDKWCLLIRKNEYQSFTGIDFDFKQLSVPLTQASPYLIGQRSSDHSWLVYDFKTEQALIAEAEYQQAIEFWLSLGLAKPLYVNARNTRELLQETEDSIALRWSMDLQMWLFMGVVPLTPVALIFWYFSKKSRQQYKTSGSILFHVFTYVFAVPVLLVIYAALSSLISIIKQNW